MKITHIYHISDIHFRNLKRHEEYREVLNQFFENIERDGIESSVIYIGGDLVHAKTDMTPELIREVSWFLRRCAELRHTFIITGNHDLNLANKSRLDALTPIIENLNLPKLHYLRDTGVYPFENLTFVVYSILSDKSEWPKAGDVKGENKICLFHGPVFSATTDVDYVISSDKFSPEMFVGFDLALLGDIHKRQEVGHPNIVYSSSAIQQNHGEDITGHGYLLWDIEKKSYTAVDLPNDYGFYTLDIVDGIIPNIDDMPKKPRLRIRTSNTNIAEVNKIIADIRKTRDIQEYTVSRIDTLSQRKSDTSNTNAAIHNIRDIETQNGLIEDYLNRRYSLDRKTLDLIRELNTETNDKITDKEAAINAVWKPKYFEFSNMFSYGEGNKIHFDRARGILGIFNPNATGKSAVIDALVFCLFDKTPRTFLAKNIMNNRKKWFDCLFVFEINGVEYHIKRVAKVVNKGKNVKVDVDFWKVEDGQVISLNGEHRRDTNRMINQYIGTYDDFVLTTLSLQTDNALFIDKSQTERKEKFAQFMGADIFDHLYQVAYDENRVNSTLLKRLNQDDFSVKLADNKTKLTEYRNEYNDLSKEIIDIKNVISDYGNQILELNKRLHKLKTDKYDIDSLKKEQQQLKQKKESIESERVAMQERLIQLEEQQFTYDDRLDMMDDELIIQNYRTMGSYNDQIYTLQNQIDKFDIKHTSLKAHLDHLNIHKYNPDCEVCLDNSKSVLDAKQETETEIKKITDKSNELIEQKNDLLSKIKKLNKYQKLYEELAEINGHISKITTEINRILDKLSNIEKNEILVDIELNRVKTDIELWNENEKQIIENQNTLLSIKEVEKKQKQRQSELTDKNNLLMDINGKISTLQTERISIKKSINQITELETQKRLYEYYLDALGKDGVAYELIEKTLPMVEGEINNILGQIVNFGIQLDMDGKNINAQIVYDEQQWSLEMCSGMERFVSSLAIRIALMNICNLPHPNFLIIDEGFGVMDSDNLQSLLMSFSYLRSQFDFVIVISHIDSMRDTVDDTIQIQNVGGYSKVKF